MCRQGLYPHCPRLPAVLGLEGAGVIIRTGKDVNHLKVRPACKHTHTHTHTHSARMINNCQLSVAHLRGCPQRVRPLLRKILDPFSSYVFTSICHGFSDSGGFNPRLCGYFLPSHVDLIYLLPGVTCHSQNPQ